MKITVAGLLAGLILTCAAPAWSVDAHTAAVTARETEFITERDLPPAEVAPQVTILDAPPARPSAAVAVITDKDLFPNAGEPLESLLAPSSRPPTVTAAPEVANHKRKRRSRRHRAVSSGDERPSLSHRRGGR